MKMKIVIMIIIASMITGGGVVYLITVTEDEHQAVNVSRPVRDEFKYIPNDDGERF